MGWRAGLPPSLEGLDDEHAPAAAGTRREMIEWLWRFHRLRRRRDGKQLAGAGNTGCQFPEMGRLFGPDFCNCFSGIALALMSRHLP